MLNRGVGLAEGGASHDVPLDRVPPGLRLRDIRLKERGRIYASLRRRLLTQLGSFVRPPAA